MHITYILLDESRLVWRQNAKPWKITKRPHIDRGAVSLSFNLWNMAAVPSDNLTKLYQAYGIYISPITIQYHQCLIFFVGFCRYCIIDVIQLAADKSTVCTSPHMPSRHRYDPHTHNSKNVCWQSLIDNACIHRLKLNMVLYYQLLNQMKRPNNSLHN